MPFETFTKSHRQMHKLQEHQTFCLLKSSLVKSGKLRLDIVGKEPKESIWTQLLQSQKRAIKRLSLPTAKHYISPQRIWTHIGQIFFESIKSSWNESHQVFWKRPDRRPATKLQAGAIRPTCNIKKLALGSNPLGTSILCETSLGV